LYKLFDVSIDAKQSVVMLFERTLHNPIDLWLTATVIVLIVPLIEEIFFRGILQSFLTKRFGAKIGIALTMFVFVVSHFTLQQGWGNIEIFLTLAVLSFFLSYIFHQRGCLWACYGLHATFNAISVMSILLIDGGAG
jgi:membrane protease YdiL (CAAX protease family)